MKYIIFIVFLQQTVVEATSVMPLLLQHFSFNISTLPEWHARCFPIGIWDGTNPNV